MHIPPTTMDACTAITATSRHTRHGRQLRYFLTVVREESITKESEVLHITQLTLSRQIVKMEEEIRVKLFHRGMRKISLTNEEMGRECRMFM